MNHSTESDEKHLNFSTVRTAAQGRWPEILTRLGIDAGYLKKRHGPCPGCGGKDRFRFDDKQGRGTWICGGGGDEKAGDGFQLLEHIHGWSRAESLQAVAEVLGLTDGVEPPPRRTAPKPARDDRQAKQARAAALARQVIEAASPADPSHPYLARKQVRPPETLRQWPVEELRRRIGYWPNAGGEALEGDVLIAPVWDWGGITTLELIDGDGRKSALSGGRKAGCWWAAQPMPESCDRLLIGEGVATVLSAIEATGWPGVAALSCGNLPRVARAMRQRYPDARIIILADLGNGQAKAEEATRAIGGHLAVPDFGPDRPEGASDFNDLALRRGLEEVREQIEAANPVGPDRPSAEKKHPLDGKKVGCYRVLSGRLYREVEKGDEVHTIAVDNFAARIVREVQRTDGLETRFLFEIEGWLGNGEPLPRALVTAREFAGLNWICEHWGSRALVYPGQAAKDHCRAAIQMMSNPERAVIYAHLGWTEIDSKPVFIHAGGGIGGAGAVDGIEVDPGTALAGFVLPEPPAPDEVAGIIRDVLTLPGTLAPDAIVWPLLLYVLGAPLGHSPFSLYLAGGSGARKTSLALVAQSFFGYRDAEPPISWEATANALEGAAFTAKDVALLVDDFAPTGDPRAQDELKRKAARVLRSQGNKTGRLRMRADGTLAGDRPPRGSLIVTGEDLPPGNSVRARCLFIEVKPEDSKRGIPGDVNLAALSEAQEKARNGHYAEMMAAWIRWLAPRLTQAQEFLRERIEKLRPQWATVHGRTTDAVARLQAVWEIFSDFAIEARAVTRAEAQAYQDRLVAALNTVAEAQASIQKHADPAERFTELLQSLFSSGRAHLLDKNDESIPPSDPGKWGWRTVQSDSLATATPWQPQGRAIGWVDESNVYLDPQAAYAELDRLAGETGEPLPSPRTLWKRLAERGVVRGTHVKDGARYSVTRTVGGRKKRICEIPTATLYVSESGSSGSRAWSPHGSKAEAGTANFCGTADNGSPAQSQQECGLPDDGGTAASGSRISSGSGLRLVTMRSTAEGTAGTANPDIRPTCENPDEKIFSPPNFTGLVDDEADRLAGESKPNGDGRDIGEI